MNTHRGWSIAARTVVAGLIAAGPSGGAALAQPGAPTAVSPDDIAFANRLSKAFKTVASSAEPAVVHIIALKRVVPRRYDWFGRVIAEGQPTLQPAGVGSGFFVDGDGTLMTNNHVVAEADELRVRTADGREFPARIVGRDEVTDLAVVRAQAPGVTFTPVAMGDSESLDVGEWVVAIGSPFGLSRTVTAGIVSAKGRSLAPRETGRAFEDFIQTDAAINPGNSGGPLLNLRGEVVGINSAIATRSGGYEGLGFAIPANLAKLVKNNILQNGRVVRGWLGVDLADAPPVAGSGERGVLVRGVSDDSPAERAGLREGDVILKFRGQPVNEARLRASISAAGPGTAVPLEVKRDGETMVMLATVGDLGDLARAMGATYERSSGLTVKPFTREMARDAGYRPVFKGVQIVELEPGGAGERSQFRPGDIIVKVEGQSVTNGKEFADALASADSARGVRLDLIRGNTQGYLTLTR